MNETIEPDNRSLEKKFFRRPCSVAVSTGDFDSPIHGSNPCKASLFPCSAYIHCFRSVVSLYQSPHSYHVVSSFQFIYSPAYFMTIIQEEKLTLKNKSDDIFDHVKAQVLIAIREDAEQDAIDNEKKRISRMGVTYAQFKDLVSTVNLVPFKRRQI
jgi:hypothetical protein